MHTTQLSEFLLHTTKTCSIFQTIKILQWIEISNIWKYFAKIPDEHRSDRSVTQGTEASLHWRQTPWSQHAISKCFVKIFLRKSFKLQKSGADYLKEIIVTFLQGLWNMIIRFLVCEVFLSFFCTRPTVTNASIMPFVKISLKAECQIVGEKDKQVEKWFFGQKKFRFPRIDFQIDCPIQLRQVRCTLNSVRCNQFPIFGILPPLFLQLLMPGCKILNQSTLVACTAIQNIKCSVINIAQFAVCNVQCTYSNV